MSIKGFTYNTISPNGNEYENFLQIKCIIRYFLVLFGIIRYYFVLFGFKSDRTGSLSKIMCRHLRLKRVFEKTIDSECGWGEGWDPPSPGFCTRNAIFYFDCSHPLQCNM